MILITTKRLAKLLEVSPRTLERKRIEGGGIPYIKIGSSVRYDMDDVNDYLDRQKRTSTSA